MKRPDGEEVMMSHPDKKTLSVPSHQVEYAQSRGYHVIRSAKEINAEIEQAVEESFSKKMKASEVCDLIEAAETAEEVEELFQNDDRKTVQNAREKRLAELNKQIAESI